MIRRRSISLSRWWSLAALAALAGAPRRAHAGDDGDDPARLARTGDEVDDDDAASPASDSAGTGAFLPSALAASSEPRRGLVSFTAGWDQARRGAIYDTTAEGQLLGRVSVMAGASYDGPGSDASPHIALRLDALRQAAHGVDLAVAAGYVDAGFNRVPAAVFELAAGRNLGASYLLGNVTYGHGLEDGERFGELRLAALVPVAPAAHVGIDSRLQVDLERDSHEPPGEVDWESRTGFVASYEWRRIVVTGGAGVSALRLRAGGSTAVGPVVTAGFGTVF